jgi:hypothetical protein
MLILGRRSARLDRLGVLPVPAVLWMGMSVIGQLPVLGVSPSGYRTGWSAGRRRC